MVVSTVRLRVLGPVVGEVDGHVVELGGPQQRAVLAYLVMNHGDVVSPSALIDRLWPEDPPASATKLIQKHVSGLRAALGSESIETTGGGYRLAVDTDGIDVARFERSIVDGAAQPEEPPAWSGPPYSGCGDLPFVVAERERLTRVRLEARLDRLAASLVDGAYGPTLAELERLAGEHPSHERVVALLMRGLYASDRQIDALRAYRRHERHLRDELGVDPSPELVDLERRILQHDDALRRSSAPVPLDPQPTGPHAERATPGTAPDRIVEEVRAVAVVLIRSGSDAAGPDDLRAQQRHADDEVRRLVTRFGGHVERTAGDDTIVLFGVPAHEDDLERAAALGRAAVEVLPSSKVVVVADDAVVAVEPTIRLLAGSLLSRARALAEGAAPGQLAADDVVARIARLQATTDTAMVGRDDELAIISDVWQRVIDDGRLRVVEVTGDAGIGKTRLLREAVVRLEPAPYRVLELGFSAFGDRTLLGALKSALVELARGFDGFDEWLDALDLPETIGKRIATQLRPLIDAAPERGPDAPDDLVTPISQLYDVLAARGPLVVVVEDIHWGRPDTVRRLSEAMLDLAGRPILALVTRRHVPALTDFDVGGIAERATLQLGELDASTASELARSVGEDLDAVSLGHATERSGGNPLFLLQYVKMLLDHPDAADRQAPDSVRLVLAARLDHLAQPLRAVIQAAAAVPRRITASAISTLIEQDLAETAAALNVLSRSGLLRRTHGEWTTAGPTFAFQHGLVADVAYSQLTRPKRIELHRRAAISIAAAASESIEDFQDIAWHWSRVIELSRAERLEPDESTRATAREALTTAAARLFHVDAGVSIETLRRAVEITDDESVERADLLMRLGAVSTDAGDLEEATTTLAEAAVIYDVLGDDARAGEALARQARALWYLGQGDSIDRLLTECFERLARAPHSPSHAHAKVVVATQTALRGRPAEALEIADRSERVVHEHGTPEDVIRLLHARGHARFDLDDEGGIQDLEDALHRTLDRGLGRLTSQSYNNLAEVTWFARGPNDAIALAREGLDIAIDGGYLGQAPWHHAQTCEMSYDIGDWDAVMRAVDAKLPLTPVVAWLLDAFGARVRFWRGAADAIDDLDRALRSARITKERQVVVPMLSASIAAHAVLGHDAEAVSLGEELVSFASDVGHHCLRDGGDATRGLCRVGRPDLARALVPARRPLILRRRLMWETAHANIAEAEQRWDDADAHHERAETGWTAFPHPFEAANAAAGRARAARKLDVEAGLIHAYEATARTRFEQLRATRCLRALDG